MSHTSVATLHSTRLGPRSWALVAGWAATWAALALPGGLYSWHYFAQAGTGFAAGGRFGGLHLFAAQRQLQFGPVSVLVAWAITRVPTPVQSPVAALVMTALGVVTFALLGAAATAVRGRPPRRVTTVAVGAALLPLWMVLAVHFGHLDDALALTFIAAAAAAIARGWPVMAVVSLALATGAKPWALPLGVLVLALDRRWAPPWQIHGRQPHRWRRGAAFLALVVLPWVPFVVADPRTLSIGTFRIDIADDSVLALFGQTGTTPPWDRPAQLILAALVAWWCVRTGRWLAAPLAVLATRMLLDPGTYGYYTAGLAVAAALIDLSGRRPARITPAVLAWWLADLVLNAAHLHTVAAILRLAALVCLLVLGMTRAKEPPAPQAAARRRRSTEAALT